MKIPFSADGARADGSPLPAPLSQRRRLPPPSPPQSRRPNGADPRPPEPKRSQAAAPPSSVQQFRGMPYSQIGDTSGLRA
eukprot:scaffold129221_cov28-Tisochrysis_lutea.AAC.3